MPRQLVNIGTAPGDGTGDDLRAGADKINDNFEELYNLTPSTIHAGNIAGATNIEKIQGAINQAIAEGDLLVQIPLSLLPYDASLITFSTSVQMIVEGGNVNVYDVKAYGARANGVDNDTASFIAADAAARLAHGTVYVGSGTYLLTPSDDTAANGLSLGSNVTLHMEPGAVLTHPPSGIGHVALLFIKAQSNVTIRGGKLLGQRAVDSPGAPVIGLRIDGGSNITVDTVRADDFSLDGFYIREDGVLGVEAEKLFFANCHANNNRRTGMACVAVRSLEIIGGSYNNTNGSPTETGIDIEPNFPMVCEDVHIVGVTAKGNVGAGVLFADVTTSGLARENTIVSCTLRNNGNAGIGVFSSSRVTITGNQSVANSYGIVLDADSSGESADDCTITGNICSGNVNDGIRFVTVTGATCRHNVVQANICRHNGHHGIALEGSSDNVVASNVAHSNGTATDNTYDNIFVDGNSNDNNIQGNTCRKGTNANSPRYGLNINAAACDTNVVTNNDLKGSGETGSLNNAGTGTVTAAGNRL